MQDVLTYGFDGAYWEITTVFGDASSRYFYSPFVRVNDGDQIEGVIYVNSGSGLNVDYTMLITDTTTTYYSENWVTSNGINWDNAYAGVLEAYYTDECTMFPNSTGVAFYNVSVQSNYASYPNQFWAPNHPNIPDYDADSDDYTGIACGFGTGQVYGTYDLLWSP
jgi:hypothetical protein